jgi:hypothetical protein
MISVSINGRIKNKKKVEEFVYNTLIHLMPRLRRTVYIDVNIVTQCEKQHYALCMGDKESVEIEVARESNGIKFSLEDMILNLAHELVHAKQFLRGELHPSLSQWKKQDFSKVVYHKTPWEKEAYLLEDKLYNKFWK